MGLCWKPKGREELGSWHPMAQNLKRLFSGGCSGEMEGERRGQKNSLERARGKAGGWRRSQDLRGRRLLGSSPSKRVRSKEAE